MEGHQSRQGCRSTRGLGVPLCTSAGAKFENEVPENKYNFTLPKYQTISFTFKTKEAITMFYGAHGGPLGTIVAVGLLRAKFGKYWLQLWGCSNIA